MSMALAAVTTPRSERSAWWGACGCAEDGDIELAAVGTDARVCIVGRVPGNHHDAVARIVAGAMGEWLIREQVPRLVVGRIGDREPDHRRFPRCRVRYLHNVVGKVLL